MISSRSAIIYLLYLETPTDSWLHCSNGETAQLPLNLLARDGDSGSNSSIFSTIDSSSGSWEVRSGSNPEGKLLAMMRITRSLHDAVSILLAKVLDSLLGIFSHTRCGIVAVSEENERVPRVATPYAIVIRRMQMDLVSTKT